ncbi:MAG: hypothetical protein JWQ87_2001 [Candidatus Sulfotelmatobacter sp.]|nr:hypothetical protein [Candidatus Sulfotelmatobacter sp.]
MTLSNDPFAPDDKFAQLDLRTGPEHFAAHLSKISEEEHIDDPNASETALRPEVIVGPTAAQAAAAAPVHGAPEVIDLGDGATVTIRQTNLGWEAVLDAGTGAGAEVFRGRTRPELDRNVYIGKLHATRKINELVRRDKLTLAADAPAAHSPAPTPAPTVRRLTPDEEFEIKTKLSANPDLALKEWFQKTTGLSLEQLVGLAQQGSAAKETLDAEAVAKSFISARPEYWNAEENYRRLLINICNRNRTKHPESFPAEAKSEPMLEYLVKHGLFTTANLIAAYDALHEDGLLLKKPEAPTAAPPAPAADTPTNVPAQLPVPAATAPPAPAPAPATPPARPTPTDGRIVRPRRENASFGIRTRDASAPSPEITSEPSVEELDNLSDTEIAQLYAGVRQNVARASAQR